MEGFYFDDFQLTGVSVTGAYFARTRRVQLDKVVGGERAPSCTSTGGHFTHIFRGGFEMAGITRWRNTLP